MGKVFTNSILKVWEVVINLPLVGVFSVQVSNGIPLLNLDDPNNKKKRQQKTGISASRGHETVVSSGRNTKGSTSRCPHSVFNTESSLFLGTFDKRGSFY